MEEHVRAAPCPGVHIWATKDDVAASDGSSPLKGVSIMK